MRLGLPGAVLLAGASVVIGLSMPAVAAGAGASQPAAPAGRAAAFPHMDHVFVIMMENTSYSDLLSPSNPNTTFIQGLATHVRARDRLLRRDAHEPAQLRRGDERKHLGFQLRRRGPGGPGVLQPPQPVDQLDQAGVSWKGYMESMPSVGYHGQLRGLHQPTPTLSAPTTHGHGLCTSASTTRSCSTRTFSTTRALADNVVPLTQLSTTSTPAVVPQFAWITPNICNDMHGGAPECPYPNSPTDPNQATLYQDGDTFLKTWVTAIMNSPAWTGNSAIFVMWDEGGYADDSPYGPETTAGAATRRSSRPPRSTPRQAAAGTSPAAPSTAVATSR